MKLTTLSFPQTVSRKQQLVGASAMVASALGGAHVAQAQPGYLPIEVLAVEQLQEGALRVSTPNGWAVLNSDEWALANGEILVREGTVMHATKIFPWAKVGYAVGGVGLVGGAGLGGYHLIMGSDSGTEAGDTQTDNQTAASGDADDAAASGADGTAPAVEETPTELQVREDYITGNTLIDSLLSADEEHWAGAGTFNQPTTVTYSFADQGSALSDEQGVDPQSVPVSFRQSVRTQLDGIEAVAGVTFVEVTDTGNFDDQTGDGRGQINIVLAEDNLNASFAVLPIGDEPWLDDRNGDVVFTGGLVDEGLWVDEYRGGAMTITHEILHALGLEHPFEGYLDAPDYIDTQFYTLLSYTPVHTDTYFPDAPMIADIAALQHLYGANMETGAGDDTYVFDSQEVFLGTIWDAGGLDTIQHNGSRDAVINLQAGQASVVGASPTYSEVYSVESIGFSDAHTIERIVMDDATDGWAEITDDRKAFRLANDPDTSDLDGDGLMGFTVYMNDGDFDYYIVDNHDVEVGMRENLQIAEGVVIEYAKGGEGGDVLAGNSAANMLTGGAGDDVLSGGAGADIFVFESSFDNDVIQDFTVGEDSLYFSGIPTGNASLVGQDTVITVPSEGTVTLENIDVTALWDTDALIA